MGLGNIWRFPYVTGKYGGSTFLFIYILVVIIMGAPLVLAEFALGRSAKSDVVDTFKRLGGRRWEIVGWMGFFSVFVILSYYAVIAGCTLAYMFKSLTGLMEEAAAGRAAEYFSAFVSDPVQVIGYQLAVMGVCVTVVYRGIDRGIEKCCKILMPVLFIFLFLLTARSLTLPGASEGLSFYLMPDISKLSYECVLTAIGQAFFSLSLAMGIDITYGSYLDENEYIPNMTRTIVCLDTLVAFMAGLIIFPAVFAFGLEAGAGPGLTFITLPNVFAKMPAGVFFSFVFFALFFIAAITTTFASLEVIVSFGIDRLKWSRPKSSLIMGSVVALFGIPSALSVGGHFPQLYGKDFLDAMDFITNNAVVPICAILTAIYVGWFWKDSKVEITCRGKYNFRSYSVWIWICRIVAPVFIGIMFIKGLVW